MHFTARLMAAMKYFKPQRNFLSKHFITICICVQIYLVFYDVCVVQGQSPPEKDTTISPSNTRSGTSPSVTTDMLFTTTAYNVSRASSTSGADGELPDYVERCPSEVDCHLLGANCINCDFNESCVYGRNVSVLCHPKEHIVCKGDQHFTRWFTCRYCYQTHHWEHHCSNTTQCHVVSAPRERYQANCTADQHLLCLGRRQFYKMLPCNWTSGKRWSTAIILSITLGGFGADRFYLGLWREGIGKLFSFGGLGVWTLVDVILIGSGYVGPADSSLYIF